MNTLIINCKPRNLIAHQFRISHPSTLSLWRALQRTVACMRLFWHWLKKPLQASQLHRFGHSLYFFDWIWAHSLEERLNLGTIFHKRSKQLLIKYAWILRFSHVEPPPQKKKYNNFAVQLRGIHSFLHWSQIHKKRRGRMVRTSDSQPECRGFESWPRHGVVSVSRIP
jgi:hypothetical protein